MKFKVEKGILSNAINTAQKGTGKTSLPILEGLLIAASNNEVKIVGSNLDITIDTKFNADVEQDGSIVLNSKLFGDIVKSLPDGEVEIEIKDNNATIKCGKTKFTMITLDANDYPKAPKVENSAEFKLSQALLKDMIKNVIYAVAKDETRPILTGVLFSFEKDKFNVAAIDGFRLAVRSENIKNNNIVKAIIPEKTLSELIKILRDDEEEVTISLSDNYVMFDTENTKITSRILEGEFIDYKKIIPQYNFIATVSKQEVYDAVNRASIMNDDKNNLVEMKLTKNDIIITSSSMLGKVTEEIGFDNLTGETLDISFNSKYLIDAIKNINTDEINLEFGSSVSPCLIKPKDDREIVHMILPVRILNH